MSSTSAPSIRAPVVAIMIFQTAALIVRASLELQLVAAGQPGPFAQDLSYLVVPPILLVLMYPILREHRAFLTALYSPKHLTTHLVLSAAGLGFALRMTYWGGLVALVSFGLLRNSDPYAIIGPEIGFDCPQPILLVLSLVVMSVLVPLTEETINRGLLLNALLQRGRVQALVICSLLFAIMHDPQAIIVAFIIGLYLGAQAMQCRTLWGPLITHATYNALAVFDWECLILRWNPTESTPATKGVALIATALLAVGIMLSLVLVCQKSIGAHSRPDA